MEDKIQGTLLAQGTAEIIKLVDPNAGSSSSSSAIKKRKKASKDPDADGKVIAQCKHCKKTFEGSRKKVIKRRNKHLEICPDNPKRKSGSDGHDGDDQHQSLSQSIKTKKLARQNTTRHNDMQTILEPSEESSHCIDFREDNNIEDHKAQERSNRTVDLERIFVITNFIFELPSVVFDQLSSVHKPQYAFLSMLTSFASLFISIFGLVCECTRENVIWKWRGALPWLYYPSPSDKLFGNFNDIVGLVCALCQCILSAITYGFVRRHADNPIKVSVWPIIFAFGLLCSNLFKKPEKSDNDKDKT